MTQKTNQNPWTMDVRVRERNLKAGSLTEKDLEKHLAALPDVADQAEPFNIAQPALTDQPQHVPAPAVAVAAPAALAADDLADEEDDEDDEDDDVADEPAAVASNGGGAPLVEEAPVGGDAAGGDVTNGGGEPT